MTFTTRVIGDSGGSMRLRLILMTASCCFRCAASVANKANRARHPMHLLRPHHRKQRRQGTNPLTSGVDFVQLLQRKSPVFPYLANRNTRPLTSWEKLKLAANNSVALSTVGAALVGAGYGQAINSPSGYGQGGSGYGKRVGAGMARGASNNVFGTFLIASVLG